METLRTVRRRSLNRVALYIEIGPFVADVLATFHDCILLLLCKTNGIKQFAMSIEHQLQLISFQAT